MSLHQHLRHNASQKTPNSITQDLADRLIVATALVDELPLVTADHNLRNSTIIDTIW